VCLVAEARSRHTNLTSKRILAPNPRPSLTELRTVRCQMKYRVSLLLYSWLLLLSCAVPADATNLCAQGKGKPDTLCSNQVREDICVVLVALLTVYRQMFGVKCCGYGRVPNEDLRSVYGVTICYWDGFGACYFTALPGANICSVGHGGRRHEYGAMAERR
jgi:hypothetical protein